jgi:hypothetical protein
MGETVKLVEQPDLEGVYPLGPSHTDAERLLWLEFQAVQAYRDINQLTQSVAALTVAVASVKGRVTLMSGIMIGIMGVFKMLPDKSLDVLRHFLAG